MSKLRKALFNPGIFFRDFLVKKYPVVFNEIGADIYTEKGLQFLEEGRNSLLENQLHIDVVFTWVNDNDKLWKSKKDLYLEDFKKNNINLISDATDDARFQNNNEIIISVKNIRKYMPWVRNIFIVTDKQTPELSLIDFDVSIVDHTDIIPSEYLPTFNSHVIEANLFKIEGLSENFIYFNDDISPMRHIAKNHFFSMNGIASLFISNKEVKEENIGTPTQFASLNSRNFLRENFSFDAPRMLVHTYFPLNKTMFYELYKILGDKGVNFQVNKFRSPDDYNLASFMVPWYMYWKGKSRECIDICHYVSARSNAIQFLEILYRNNLNFRPDSICINESNSLMSKKSDGLIKYLIEKND